MARKQKMPHKRPFDKLTLVNDTISEDIFESSTRVRTSHLAEWKTLKTLIASTSDICRARYHYYCHEEEADFASVAQEYFVVAANCKMLEVHDPDKDDELTSIEDSHARLVVQQTESPFYHSKGKRFAFVAEKNQNWQSEYIDQLVELGASRQHDPSKLDAVFFPEFGFPVEPKNSSAKSFLEKVATQCVLAVHRPFFFTGSAHQEPPVLNRGFVSPPCIDGAGNAHNALETIAVFERKTEMVFKTLPSELKGLVLKHQKNGKLQVRFKTGSAEEVIEYSSEDFDKSVRSQKDDEKFTKLGADAKPFVNNAYKFNDSIFNAERQRKELHTKLPNGFLPITKKAPALKLKEALEPQGMLDLDVFVTKLGVFAVLICYDAFDPRMFLTLLRLYQGSLNKLKDFEHPAPDVILVPAFNRSKKLLLMCRNLSFATNSIVVYASNHEEHAGKPIVYVCGREWQAWEEALSGSKQGKIENFFDVSKSKDFVVLKLHRPTLNHVMSLAANREAVTTKTVKDRAVTNGLFQ